MCDVYLGGVADREWRTVFKGEIDSDISIFDPVVENYDSLSEEEKSNQIAREMFHLDRSTIIVFYFNEYWQGSMSLIQLGETVAKGKNVIVCVDGNVRGLDRIKMYCEYKGVIIVKTMEELITTVEEYLAQIEMCKNNDI